MTGLFCFLRAPRQQRQQKQYGYSETHLLLVNLLCSSVRFVQPLEFFDFAARGRTELHGGAHKCTTGLALCGWVRSALRNESAKPRRIGTRTHANDAKGGTPARGNRHAKRRLICTLRTHAGSIHPVFGRPGNDETSFPLIASCCFSLLLLASYCAKMRVDFLKEFC